MTDPCKIQAEVEAADPLSVASSLDPVEVQIETPDPLEVSVQDNEDVLAVLRSQRTRVTIEDVDDLLAIVEEVSELLAEVDEVGWSSTQQAKLASIEWGARRYQPDYITLVRATALGVSSGDSDPWVFSTTFGEMVAWRVAHPAWRGSGIMEINCLFKYLRGGAPTTATFELQVQDDFPTSLDVDPLVFGLPQPWTTVSTFTTPNLANSGNEETLYWSVQLVHEGNTGATYRQVAIHSTNSTDSGGAPTVHASEQLLLTTIDTSKSFRMRILAKMGAFGVGDYFHGVAAYVGLAHPRDGHGY